VRKQLSGFAKGFSPDGLALASAWLRSPEQARSAYFCEDGLPESWRAYTPQRYVVEAVLTFDLAVAEREGLLCGTAQAEREQAAVELQGLRTALLQRFVATYGGDEQAHRDRLDERLALMWEVLVEPMHSGLDATQRLGADAPSPTNLGMFYVPDLFDVAKRDTIGRAWQEETSKLAADIDALRARQAAAVSALAGTEGLDAQATGAAALDRDLTTTLVALSRFEDRVQAFDADDVIVTGLVKDKYTREQLTAIWELEVAIDGLRNELRTALEGAVANGAAKPEGLLPYDQPSAQRSINEGALSVEGQGPVVGPGNWIAGLPFSTDATNLGSAQSLRSLLGSGWVERTFEGPLPTPRDVWSAALVERIVAGAEGLDATDAKVLLELAAALFTELPDATSVEFAVRYTLLRGGGLNLYGYEGELSDWLAGGLPAGGAPAAVEGAEGDDAADGEAAPLAPAGAQVRLYFGDAPS
jgi:hypothetical protein